MKNQNHSLYPRFDHINKKGSIELDSIGRKEIFEKKLRDGYKLNYNERGFMEIIECN